MLTEVPSQFRYLVDSSTYGGQWREPEEPPFKIACEGFPVTRNFCRSLKTLSCSTLCENDIQFQNTGNFAETEDVFSSFTGEYYHIFFQLKSFVGAENFIKETSVKISQENTTYKNSDQLCRIVYSIITGKLFEESLTMETTDALYLAVERKKVNQLKTWDANLKVWEFWRSCYTEFDKIENSDKLSYLCRRLAELKNSNAIVKDCVIDFSNLLQRGFGSINIAHHNNVLKVELR